MGKDKGQDREARELLSELEKDPRVLRMKEYTQHGGTSAYDHCVDVARKSLKVAEKFKGTDRKAVVMGALLHDYFLYDWHSKGDRLHGYHHPKIAAQKAREDFAVSDKEAQIISSHMWPLTLTAVPKSREAWIVCMADKWCSLKETVGGRLGKKSGKKGGD